MQRVEIDRSRSPRGECDKGLLGVIPLRSAPENSA
jgi:hypothetical protein